MLYGIIAVLALFAVIAAKYITSARLQHLNLSLVEAEKEFRRIKGNLKVAENNKAVTDLELKEGERKKQNLQRQIEKYDRQLAGSKD